MFQVVGCVCRRFDLSALSRLPLGPLLLLLLLLQF